MCTVYAFPSRRLTVAELINYWRWRGYRVGSDLRGRIILTKVNP